MCASQCGRIILIVLFLLLLLPVVISQFWKQQRTFKTYKKSQRDYQSFLLIIMRIQKGFDQIVHLLKLGRSSVALQNRLKSFWQEHSYFTKLSFLCDISSKMKKLHDFFILNFCCFRKWVLFQKVVNPIVNCTVAALAAAWRRHGAPQL